MYKNLVNNGKKTTNLNWCVSAGCLNHQPYCGSMGLPSSTSAIHLASFDLRNGASIFLTRPEVQMMVWLLWVPSMRRCLVGDVDGQMSHEENLAGYFPLNPACLIGILTMIYKIVPIKLGSIIPYIKQPTTVFFIAQICRVMDLDIGICYIIPPNHPDWWNSTIPPSHFIIGSKLNRYIDVIKNPLKDYHSLDLLPHSDHQDLVTFLGSGIPS